jgi:hypothetical protein
LRKPKTQHAISRFTAAGLRDQAYSAYGEPCGSNEHEDTTVRAHTASLSKLGMQRNQNHSSLSRLSTQRAPDQVYQVSRASTSKMRSVSFKSLSRVSTARFRACQLAMSAPLPPDPQEVTAVTEEIATRSRATSSKSRAATRSRATSSKSRAVSSKPREYDDTATSLELSAHTRGVNLVLGDDITLRPTTSRPVLTHASSRESVVTHRNTSAQVPLAKDMGSILAEMPTALPSARRLAVRSFSHSL